MDDFKTMGEVMAEVAQAMDAPTERSSTCEKHGEFVSKRYQLYEGGREHWSRCLDCEAERKAADEALRAAREAQEQARLHEDRLNRAGIPSRFRSRTLASFVADTPAKQRALCIAQDFATNFRDKYAEGSNLIFSGLPGTGKSHLALGIAQALMPTWSSVYVTARELVMRLRETWRQNSEISEMDMQHVFTRTHLLIIDEIGVQFGTDAERTQLFGIIDERYREQLPSILLTNLGLDDFKQFVGHRAYDRLRESGLWVPFEWESYRGQHG